MTPGLYDAIMKLSIECPDQALVMAVLELAESVDAQTTAFNETFLNVGVRTVDAT
jgi:hypothetical protein